MARFEPIPDPAGALGPPRRFPPTAVATATPEPEPLRPRVPARRRSAIRRLIGGLLDLTDRAVEALQSAIRRGH